MGLCVRVYILAVLSAGQSLLSPPFPLFRSGLQVSLQLS